jgi:signal transduction histidine kinase
MKLPWSDPRLPSALQRALLMAAGVASVFAWVTATRVVYLPPAAGSPGPLAAAAAVWIGLFVATLVMAAVAGFGQAWLPSLPRARRVGLAVLVLACWACGGGLLAVQTWRFGPASGIDPAGLPTLLLPLGAFALLLVAIEAAARRRPAVAVVPGRIPATRPRIPPSMVRALLVAVSVASAWAVVAVARVAVSPMVPNAPSPWATGAKVWIGNFSMILMMGSAATLGRMLLPAAAAPRRLALVLLVLGTWAAGCVLLVLQEVVHGNDAGFDARYLPAILLPMGTIALLLVAMEEFAQRRQAASQALHEGGLRNLALAREMSEAELSLLQAQIEPHFLFNTLANVRRLLRTDRGAAQALLAALLRYLEETLPRLRESSRSTLEREASLVRAYLELHQVRMGSRLRWSVEVPPSLGGQEVPPLLLLTLVENALKHGLAPQVQGGRIDVAARFDDGQVVLSVADTGRGMGSAIGHGTGLANLRARLKAMYGPAASLVLRVNDPHGVIAQVSLPERRL